MIFSNDIPVEEPRDLNDGRPEMPRNRDADPPVVSADAGDGDGAHDVEGYLGRQTATDSDAGETPAAGDVDPDATASADATGQGGDTQRKGIGHPYSS